MEQERARRRSYCATSTKLCLASVAIEGLPIRAGYYLGYLFAKSKGDGQSLPQLARMAPRTIHGEAVAFLTQLAQAGGTERERRADPSGR